MEPSKLNWIANFIWGIADDILRDLYVRGKYRDVILPMTVLRRLDVMLEPTKQSVLDMKASLDKAGITNQDQALRQKCCSLTKKFGGDRCRLVSEFCLKPTTAGGKWQV
jgi:type I restriction-modification system DNA methylase subunit